MRIFIKRLVALMLILYLAVTPSMTSFANLSNGGSFRGGDADWGRMPYNQPYGWRVGLGQCTNRMYDGAAGDPKALSDWLFGYFTNHYVTCQGDPYYFDLDGNQLTNGTRHPDTDEPLSSKYPDAASAEIFKAILTELRIDNEAALTYTKLIPKISAVTGETENCHALKEEYIEIVMDALKPTNPQLYQTWLNTKNSTNYYPVVIVFETVCCLTTPNGGRYGVTCADYANLIPGCSAATLTSERLFNWQTGEAPKCIDGTGSLTGGFIAYSGNYHNRKINNNAFPYKIGKHLFGVSYKAESYRNELVNIPVGEFKMVSKLPAGVLLWGDGSRHNVTNEGNPGPNGAHLAIQDPFQINNASGSGGVVVVPRIDGCYCIQIGAPKVEGLYGSYTWHIDANALPANSTGHKEDSLVEVPSPTISDPTTINSFDLSQSNYGDWANYIETNAITDAKVTLKIYHAGTDANKAEFSTDYSTVEGKSSGAIVGALDTEHTVTMSAEDLLGYLKTEDTRDFPIFDDKKTELATTHGTNPREGFLGTSYITKVTVDLYVGGALKTTVQLANTQVHWAAYNSAKSKTYKFLQVIDEAGTQVKQGQLDNEIYEAMAGVPTTEDLFISQGSNQWVVDLQYRYCNDDYKRKYIIETADKGDAAVPNYLFYSVDGYNTDASNTKEGSFETGLYIGETDHATNVNPGDNNYGFVDNEASESEASKPSTKNNKAYTDARKQLASELQNVLSSINHNHDHGNYCYDNCITSADSGCSTADTNTINSLKEFITTLNTDITNLTTQSSIGADISREFILFNTSSVKDMDSSASGTVKVKAEIIGSKGSTTTQHNSKTFVTKYCTTAICTNANHMGTEGGHTAVTGVSSNCPSYAAGDLHSGVITESHSAWTHTTHTANQSCCSTTVHTHGTGCNQNNCSNKVNGVATEHTHTTTCTCTNTAEGHVHGTGCTYDHSEHTHSSSCCSTSEHTHGSGCSCSQAGKYASCAVGSHIKETCTHYGPVTSNIPNACASTVVYAQDKWERKYTWKVTVTYTGNVQKNAGAKSAAGGQRGQNLDEHLEFYQVFEDVKYMDIVDYHVWQLKGGVEKGLGQLITQVVNDQTLFDMACKTKGYTFYNVQHSEWGDFTETATPSGETLVWRYVPDDVSELASLGRLANSYSIGSSDSDNVPTLTLNGYVNGDEHALKVLDCGDTVSLQYDIAEQGGRSHMSIDAFLKQAMALSFYKCRLADTAYRNYIMVQSDYLSLNYGDDSTGVLTFCGLQYNTDGFRKSSTTYDNEADELYQAILTTSSDAISKCHPKATKDATAEYWVKATAWNTDPGHADGKPDPSLDTYRGMEKLETYAFNGGKVKLNDTYGDAYADLTRETLNGDDTGKPVADAINDAYATSFINIDLDFEKDMPYIGYHYDYQTTTASHKVKVGAGDGVKPQTYNPAATFVGTSGYTDSLCAAPKKTKFSDLGTLATEKSVANLTVVTDNANNIKTLAGEDPTHYFPYDYDEPVAEGTPDNGSDTQNKFNIHRLMRNNRYSTGWGATFYDEELHTSTGEEAALLAENLTSMCMYKNYNDAHDSLKDCFNLGGAATGGTSTTTTQITADLVHGAGYTGSKSPVNDVVIFNPVSSETATVYLGSASDASSKIVTDGATESVDNPEMIRDQRSAPYVITTEGESEQIIVGSDPGDIDLSEVITNYDLRIPSAYPTQYFTADDYTTGSNSFEKEIPVGEDKAWTVSASGNYSLSLSSGVSNRLDVTTKLSANDKLYTDGTAVWLHPYAYGSINLTHGTLEEAVIAYYKSNVPSNVQAALDADPTQNLETLVRNYCITENGIKVSNNANMQFSTGNISIPAGAVVEIKLHSSNINHDFSFTTSKSEDLTTTDTYSYYDAAEGCWVFYLEFAKPTTLVSLNVKFKGDDIIERVDGSLMNFKDIMLFDLGAVHVDPPVKKGTIEYKYNNASEHYMDKTTRKSAINGDLCVFNGECGYNATLSAGLLGITYIGESHAGVLSADALSNPHKNYNSNWRYYVVGWMTADGKIVDSINSPLLKDDNTILKWPNSTETIKVGTLRTSAVLVRYLGNVYLTTKSAVLNDEDSDGKPDRVIMSAGIAVSEFDYINLCEASHTVSMDTAEAGVYPLASKTGGAEDDKILAGAYEFCFMLTDDDGVVFDVSRATNLDYKIDRTDTSTNYIDMSGVNKEVYTENWMLDWTKHVTTDSKQAIKNSSGGLIDRSSYLALDDAFSIYWDNTGSFAGNGAHNIGAPQVIQGYGWDTGYDRDHVPEKFDEFKSWFNGSGKPTDTSKWMMTKTITFSFPVYAFIDEETDAVNPTLKAYYINDAGKKVCRKVQRYDAGEEIPLGEYRGSSNATDNTGGFVDYGAPGVTKADEPYTYHFWLPLEAGEIFRASINYKVEGFNGNDSDGSYGNKSMTNKNNNNQYFRYADACKGGVIDTVGRIGALTIVDSGDINFSDSFKYSVDDKSEEVKDYYIYPLIRKVGTYSNEHITYNNTLGKVLPANSGKQKKILLDPFDVRGRLAEQSIIDLAKTKMTIDDDYNTYVLDKDGHSAYNTYGSQWFKNKTEDSSNTGSQKTIVPLTSEFNEHVALKATEQKLGYELYLSLESIGNYYGYSNFDLEEDIEEGDTEEDRYTNDNGDYNNRKVQVRPVYFAVDAMDGSDSSTTYTGPVDVYMNKNGSYVQINSGLPTDKSIDPNGAIDVLRTAYHAYYPYSIETNTGKSITDLDQNMKRRMVTAEEAKRTKVVLNSCNILTSILEPVSVYDAALGASNMNNNYMYGNAQYLFLRERNRTFVGGPTIAVDDSEVYDFTKEKYETMYKYDTGDAPDSEFMVMQNAQKWYFGLGLPASAVFVPAGQPFTSENILKTGYIVSTVDVYANGEVWLLHYESEVSKMKLDVGGRETSVRELAGGIPEFEWCVPVSYYNLQNSTSRDDLDTEGSH